MEKWKETLINGIAIALVSYLLIKAIILKILEWFGYSRRGVVAGSPAANMHRRIGNVPAGSWFASLQSIAMSGFSNRTMLIICGAICGTIGGFYCSYIRPCIVIGTVLGYILGCRFT